MHFLLSNLLGAFFALLKTQPDVHQHMAMQLRRCPGQLFHSCLLALQVEGQFLMSADFLNVILAGDATSYCRHLVCCL